MLMKPCTKGNRCSQPRNGLSSDSHDCSAQASPANSCATHAQASAISWCAFVLPSHVANIRFQCCNGYWKILPHFSSLTCGRDKENIILFSWFFFFKRSVNKSAFWMYWDGTACSGGRIQQVEINYADQTKACTINRSAKITLFYFFLNIFNLRFCFYWTDESLPFKYIPFRYKNLVRGGSYQNPTQI